MRVWMIAGLVLGASLACSLPSATPTVESQALATGVSATLTALAPSPAADTPAATSLVEPTTEPATPSPAPTIEGPFAPSPVLRIVYTDAGNVWIIDGASPAAQLTTTGDAYKVVISSDGERIVYLRRAAGQQQSAEIRVIHRDGTGEATLLTAAQVNGLYPLQNLVYNNIGQIAFIPGTHQLLMNSAAFAEGPGVLNRNDLLQLDADSGNLQTILPSGSGGSFTLSPDATHMAIARPDSVSLAAIDGSGMHLNVINYKPVITYSEYQYYAQPVWSPDSSRFGVAISSEDPLAPRVTGTLWSVASPDGAATQLGTMAGDFFFIQTGAAPCLSPNLDWVVFLRPGASESAPPNILLAHPDSSGLGVYDQGYGRFQGWSPNGVRFAYASGGPSNLYIGVPEAPRIPIGQGTSLRWLDDDQFLYLGGANGAWTLRRSMPGSGMQVLASPAGDMVSYDFAPPP
jgi:hypothetical protein